eukprot:SAG31_NODE_5666_length_2394_cov_1.342919_1_plen_672_part_10
MAEQLRRYQLNGVNLDWENGNSIGNSTEVLVSVIGALSDALAPDGNTVSLCVASGWMQYLGRDAWRKYRQAGAHQLITMSTYPLTQPFSARQQQQVVDDMVKQLDPGAIGIGLWAKRGRGWSELRLRTFLDYVSASGVRTVAVFCADLWGRAEPPDPYWLSTLGEWLNRSGRPMAPIGNQRARHSGQRRSDDGVGILSPRREIAADARATGQLHLMFGAAAERKSGGDSEVSSVRNISECLQMPHGDLSPCSQDNQICGPMAFKYTFHLSDQHGCGLNDPNGPFFDPIHGMYHLMYQDHLALPQPGQGSSLTGPSWGHWASRDLATWTQLPVAIWNDQWWDAAAVYSGSATVVDGKPVVIYPGLYAPSPSPPVDSAWVDYDVRVDHDTRQHSYAMAVPANLSDPFYRNWTKVINGSKNPLFTQVGDDPSSAWQTAAGEWTFIGNTGCHVSKTEGGTEMYATMDWRVFYKKGCARLPGGDCPSMFPLPELTRGSELGLTKKQIENLPNFVHVSGDKHNDDHCVPGLWTDSTIAGPGNVGSWIPIGPANAVDKGRTHAAKDFWDPVKKRRILYLWAWQGNGSMTIPRHLTYDARTQKINYAPIEEMKRLRRHTLGSIGASNTPTELLVSSACDMEVFFERPTATTVLAVELAGGIVSVNYVQGANTTNVSYSKI